MDENAPARSRSGSEKRQRTKVRPIRLDEAELAECENAASRFGLTFSSFGRSAMLSIARGAALKGLPVRSVRRPPVEKEMLAKLLGQLGKVGSNVNQVARAAHTTGAERAEIDATMAEVRAAAEAITSALGRRG